MNIFSTKGKLYADTDKTQSWKERGKGTFKVNVGRRDTKLARIGKCCSCSFQWEIFFFRQCV